MATIDKDEIEKYIFNPDNPRACRSYKLLLNIAKKENASFFSPEFLQYFYQDQIITKEFDEQIWDKPDNYSELSYSEKIELFKEQVSITEFSELVNKVNLLKSNLFQYSLMQNIITIRDDFNGMDYFNLYDYTSFSRDKELLEDGNIFNYLVTDDSWGSVEEPLGGSKYNFVIWSKHYFQILYDEGIHRSSIFITLEENIDEFLEINKNQNIKPLFLNKIEDVDLLLNVLEKDLKGEQAQSVEQEEIATLDFIEINNVFSIENIKLENLQDKKEIYIVGENGDGKTLLLQSIAVGLKGVNEDGLKVFRDIEEQYSIEVANRELCQNNFIAYGSSRNNSCNMKIDKSGYLTLFQSNFDLYNPIKWLQYLDHSQKADKSTVISLEDAKALIAHLLNREIEINIVPSMVADDGVEFREKDVPVTFNQLSAGYRSVIILICDLITRLSEKQSVEDISQFQGIVLIDEVELHLHPKWKYSFMQKLRETFPLIQFIVTTHSPTVILGASKEAVFYKVYKDEGEVKISNPIVNEGYTHNSLVSSPLFDLGTIASRNLDNKRISSDDYVYDKIHQVVFQKVKEKIEMNEEEILKLIEDELDKL